eukprot:m.33699 g.33699  ORF g.33699 m.33699 type:complete len:393 (+) comp16857_c2_seq1:74-1252(+)
MRTFNPTQMLFFTVVSLMLVSTTYAQANWTRFALTDAAKNNGAVCLDGSPGGGYIRKGDPKRWIIFNQGGGWCSSDSNCAQRANSTLGSSIHWPATYTDTYEGSELFATKPFSEFTIMFVMYCDGGSLSGNVSEPVNVDGQLVYYRGRRLLDGVIDYALSEGLSNADELLFSGCSAGGLTTYLHADYVASRMPTTVNTVAVADAMFSVNHNSIANQPLYPSRMQWGYAAWNSKASVNQDCLQALGGADGVDGWKCMFGASVAPFIKTPLFVVNSKYDTWQEKAIIGVDCSIAACNKTEQAFWANYSHIMVEIAQALPSQHGVFLTNCPAHCQLGIANFPNATIDGTSMADAVTMWYNSHQHQQPQHQQQLTSMRWIETCDILPCGADTCYKR